MPKKNASQGSQQYRFVIGSLTFSESRTEILQAAAATPPGTQPDFSKWPESQLSGDPDEDGSPVTAFDYESRDGVEATWQGRAEAWINGCPADNNWSDLLVYDGKQWFIINGKQRSPIKGI